MKCMIMDNALFRRIEMQLLMNLTARALNQPSRRLWTLPKKRALQAYAEFTRDQLQHGVSDEQLGRMNHEAFKMGRRLRRLFLLHKQERAERFIKRLYGNIGIELEGHIPGRLCVRRCFFSQHYSPHICLAASALDDGIIRGVAGYGPLVFHQRITEGCDCCLATTKSDPNKTKEQS